MPVPVLAAAVVSDDELLPPHAASRRVPVMAREMEKLMVRQTEIETEKYLG